MGEQGAIGSSTRALWAALVVAASAPMLLFAEPVSLPDLSGAWAELQILSEFAALPLVGEVARTSTVILRVVIERSGSSLLSRWTYCATEVDSGTAIATTEVPSAFLDSLGEHWAEVSLDASSIPTRFAQRWAAVVGGAELADPERDPLPTSADDPRVADQDGDGRPGLTVRASVLEILPGDVYVVQRLGFELWGTVVSPDRIEGQVTWSGEQVALAATNPLFLCNLVSRPDPAAEHSTFILVRIDPAWTCADILAHRDELFGR